MTISNEISDLLHVAGICPIAAAVFAEPTGKRFHVHFLGGREVPEGEIATWCKKGLTEFAGSMGLTKDSEFLSAAKPEFTSTVHRAAAVFLSQVKELGRIAGLMDPRAQA